MASSREDSDNLIKEIYIPEEEPVVIDKGIGEIVMEEIKKHSSIIAQIDPVTGLKENFESLLSRSIRVAQNLQVKRLKPGDIISMCTYNNLDYTPVVLASFFTGCYNAAMDPTSPLCDFVHLLKLVTPKILFCDNDKESIMERAVNEAGLKIDIVVFGETERNVHFSEYLKEQGPEEDFQIYKPESVYDTCCIQFSSGTTGLPKAVCVTHYGLAYVCHTLKGTEVSREFKTVMIATTPFWISNMISLILAILCGNTRVMPKKFNENTCMKYVQEYKINILFVTPVNGSKLLQNPEYYNYDLSSLEVIVSGGSPTSVKQFLDYLKVFPNVLVVDGYGMTETGGLVLKLYLKTEEELKRTNRAPVGTPVPGFRYKVVDLETEKACGPNKPGELRVECESMFKMYYRNPKAYEEAFDSDGFFKTGDILYYDEDYIFTYVTRIKDIFKYMGWHISPVLIEQELLKHPNINQAVVVGIPVDGEGDHATAVVVVEDKEKFDEEEIMQFIRGHLPYRYQIPGGVYIIDSIPQTSTGKLQRQNIIDFVLHQR